MFLGWYFNVFQVKERQIYMCCIVLGSANCLYFVYCLIVMLIYLESICALCLLLPCTSSYTLYFHMLV